MTLPFAAKALGVSWHRAWQMLLDGRLEGEQVAGRWLVTVESVELVRAELAQRARGDNAPSPA